MKHIITFSLITAICWMTWVPAFAQSSDLSSGDYVVQFMGGTFLSIVSSAVGAIAAGGVGFTVLSLPINLECDRKCQLDKGNTLLFSMIFGALAGLSIGAVIGVSYATPESVQGNWLGALFGAVLGETVGIGSLMWVAFQVLKGEIKMSTPDSNVLAWQLMTLTVILTSTGATIGFNLGATTSD